LHFAGVFCSPPLFCVAEEKRTALLFLPGSWGEDP
jgi:hypothetical protein